MDEPVSCVRLRTSYQLPRGLHVEKHLHRDRGLHAEKHLHRDKCHATFLLPPEDQRLENQGEKKEEEEKTKGAFFRALISLRGQLFFMKLH